MKVFLFFFGIIFIQTSFSQKFEFTIGLCPTWSLTGNNIQLSRTPDVKPTITIEDARNPGNFKTKTVDWIQTKNYFGIEPSLEIGYHLGKEVSIGLGFFGRNRQVKYDFFIPITEGVAAYTHQFQLGFIFVASTIGFQYKHPSQHWNLDFNIGFNVPLNKLDDLGEFYLNTGLYAVTEEVTGPLRNTVSVPSLDFTNYPLLRLTINKTLSNRIELGLMLERQFGNEYGSIVRVIDNATGDSILSGHVEGNDLTLGIKFGYKVFSKSKD